jgi:hypothetical protein
MTLKEKSELFHAFEWLRMQALAGNDHAATALLEWERLAEELKKLRKKPLTSNQGP